MANIFVCCDGTWNTADNEENGVPAPTNVRKIHASFANKDKNNVPQKSYYREGVGTSGGVLKRAFGGAIGLNIEDDIKSAYMYLAENYENGDKVFLFGFSRGAYAVRSLAGMIAKTGLHRFRDTEISEEERWRLVHAALLSYQIGKQGASLNLFQRGALHNYRKPRTEHQKPDPIDIEFIGVWDTVGSLGVPDDLGLSKAVLSNLRKQKFHDTSLGKDVKCARHALALDERRVDFSPTLWTETQDRDIKQKWFAGVHGDVGGSYSSHELGDVSLKWIMQESQNCGAVFRPEALQELNPNPRGIRHVSVKGFFAFRWTRPRAVPDFSTGTDELTEISDAAKERHRFPAIGEPQYWPTEKLPQGSQAAISVRVDVEERWAQTGLFLEAGQVYKLSASGIWLDGSIKVGPDGPLPGFQPGRLAHVLAAPAEWYRAGIRSIPISRKADNRLARRRPEAPWCTLMACVANGRGGEPKTNHRQGHEYFAIGSSGEVKPTKNGYLYVFVNDAFGFYGNNAGSLKLSVERL